MQNTTPNQHNQHNSQPLIPIISVPHPKTNLSSTQPSITPQQQIEHYRQNYLHLLQQNQMLQASLARAIREKESIEARFNSFRPQMSSERSDTEEKKKRHRRIASEIERDFCCPNQKCGKSYGTDASLVQHIKLKHHEYFQSSQYEKFINEIRRSKGYRKQQRVALSSLSIDNQEK